MDKGHADKGRQEGKEHPMQKLASLVKEFGLVAKANGSHWVILNKEQRKIRSGF